MTPRLEILVSTYDAEGLERCTSNVWPRIDGVAYLVSCQYTDTAPVVPDTLSDRDDVRIVFTPTHGLSANRNNALEAATASYVLIADDDTDFFADALAAVIAEFEANPDIDIITTRYETPTHKKYPADGHDLARRTPGYYVSSIEIALRRQSVIDTGLRFSVLAGLGAPRLCQGEEEIFIINALRRGLHGRFRNLVIARHPHASTGERTPGPAALRSRGAVIHKRRPLLGWASIVVNAWRLRHIAGFGTALRHMTAGAFYALRHRNRL